jgi:hypothetical protein
MAFSSQFSIRLPNEIDYIKQGRLEEARRVREEGNRIKAERKGEREIWFWNRGRTDKKRMCDGRGITSYKWAQLGSNQRPISYEEIAL